MDVKVLFKTEEGFIKFEGSLSDEEHSYVLGYGLNELMRKGALNGIAAEAAPEGTQLQ